MHPSFFKLLVLLAAVGLPTTVGATPVLQGAPGPIVGAGLLPALAVCFGVYWLTKGRRRKAD